MKKLIVILGVVGVSLSAIFVRLSEAPAMVLVFYRMSLAALVLVPTMLLRCRDELKALTRRELLLSLLSGVFLGLHFICYFSSLDYTTIAASVVLVDTEVFFVALASPFLFHKRVSGLGWVGIGLTFLGSVLIAASGFRGGGSALLGDGLALLGAAFVSVYTLIGTAVRKTRSTTIYTALVYTAGSMTVLLALALTGTPVLGYGPKDYAAGLGLAVCCTLLGHSVFSWGLKYVAPAFVSTVKLLEPVFATILGIFLFREIPEALVVLGGMLVILGVAWYSHTADAA